MSTLAWKLLAGIQVAAGALVLLQGSTVNAQPAPTASTGSGLLLSDAGIVVTNHHVIDEAERIEVLFPDVGVTFRASVLMNDVQNDLALLQVLEFDRAPWANQSWFAIGDQSTVRPGSEVFALGYPLGDLLGSKVRVSKGSVSSVFGLRDDPRLLHIDNPIQPGNSGGPLFDKNGDLIGIVVARLNAKYFFDNLGVIPENVNFAIKASYLRNLLEMIPQGAAVIGRRSGMPSVTSAESVIERVSPLVAKVYAVRRATVAEDDTPTERKLAGAITYLNLQQVADKSKLGQTLRARVKALKDQKMLELEQQPQRKRDAFTRQAQKDVQALQSACQKEFERKLVPVLNEFGLKTGIRVIFSEADVDGAIWAPPGASYRGLWGRPGENITKIAVELLDKTWP